MIEIYQLKIVANDIQPKIERILLIKSTASFYNLHHTIQCLFGLAGGHLFEFQMEYDNSPISDGSDGSRSASRIRLSSEFKVVKKLHYTYDFGDCWEFTVTLQRTFPNDNILSYPFCVAGSGGMLIKDCGGPYCYNLITAWCRNKTDKNKAILLEHYGDEEMIEAYEGFDPDEFNRDKINQLIGKKEK